MAVFGLKEWLRTGRTNQKAAFRVKEGPRMGRTNQNAAFGVAMSLK